MDSSGLTCSSLEALLVTAALTEQQIRTFEQKSVDFIYKSMKNIRDGGDQARGDLEHQFRCYMKAGELGQLAMKHPTFHKWATDPHHAMVFKSDLSNIIQASSKLQTILKKKYEDAQLRRDQMERAAAQDAEKRTGNAPPATMRALRAVITPRELVRKVEMDNPKKSALIFDLRQNQSETIFYVRSEMITIIQVPYDLIDSSLTFQSLRNNLAVNQRALLPRVSGSDYVVLMDDDTPELLNNSPAPKTKMSFLFKALTQYNQTEKPRERPMFMDGGFRMWKAQYPNYTKNEQPMSPRSIPTDDLDQVISAYHTLYSEVSHIIYPDIMENPLEPAKKQPIIPPRPSLSQISPPIPPEPVAPAQKPGFGVYPSANISVNKQPIPPPPAQFDRPGPPIFNAPPTKPTVPQPPPPPQTPPILPYPDRSVKPTVLPERPADPNGARQNGGGDLKRPPMLDRGTKPPTQTISKEYEAQLLSIHDQMKAAIDRSSRRSAAGNPGATGLTNMGNTCFMSATLQCLFQTPGLPEVFTKRSFASKVNTENRMGSKGIVSAGFSALSDAIWEGRYDSIKPARFLQLFADEVSHVLSDGRQHDASEFQIFLLDALHEDTNQAKRIGFEQNYKGGASIRKEAEDFLRKHYLFTCSPVNRLLGSISVSEIRCETCRESSATFEENTIISVELTSTSTCSLENCLKSHFSATKLDGDSRWNCPKCRQPRVSTRSSKLWALPSILIIHLKRFALFNGEFEKNSASVTFDASRFDARPFLHESASTERTHYKLYAATIHNGRLNSGHYTAVAAHLKTDKWLRFDDETVAPTEKYRVDPSLAYILFYKRC